MPRVIISLANDKLENYLLRSTENFRYIYAGEKDENIIKLLNKKGFSEIEDETHDSSFRDCFCKEYIDLVGKIGLKNNSLYWWVTFTASKNRFASELSHKLSSFYSIISKLKKNSQQNILIINPDEFVCRSLTRYLNSQDLNVKVICFEHKINQLINRIVRIIKLLVVISPTFIYGIWKKKYISNRYLRKRLTGKSKRDKPYYVIKTFIYDSSFDSSNNYRDSFFGVLPEYIRKRGEEVLILANILGDYQKAVTNIKNCEDFVIIPQEYLISYIDPVKVVLTLLVNRLVVKEKVEFFGLDVTDIVNSEVSRDYESGSVFEDYLHFIYVKNLLKLTKIGTFALTHENNPWERVCIAALRQHSPSTRIIGYQHTVVPQASANMFMSEFEKDVAPLPDKILTVGSVPKKIMEQYGSYKDSTIKPSCGLRFEHLFHTSATRRKQTGNILVAPEGVFEAYKMINYVLKELANKTQYQVTIRTHPVLPLNKFQHKLEHSLSMASNFKISNGATLEEDINSADIVIYWGSTVALEALMMGKPIIHFDTCDILSYDPLFECNHLKWTVTENDRLTDAIEEIYNIDNELFYLQQKHAREYLKDYFHEISEEALQKFLN